jgi:choline dehydrogenase-like flavoprotein
VIPGGKKKTMGPGRRDYDVIIIGSGFGGAFVADPLVRAGARVLMLERGGHVTRGAHNWAAQGSMDLTPYAKGETTFRAEAGGQNPIMHITGCVGGQSVFYGGVSFRMRERDFEPDPDIVTDSGALWPIGYADLETYYADVERRLDVAGIAGADPTEPDRRGEPYPQVPPPFSPTAKRVADAGRELGLKPFPLPLAIHYRNEPGREACIACPTCDTFACAVGAKNDLATGLIPDLVQRGLELRTHMAVVGLHEKGGRIAEVECIDRTRAIRVSFAAATVILAGGAIASPHLLLATGLAGKSPAADAVGRYLCRHVNGIALGCFAKLPDGGKQFHKQVGFHDFYFGHERIQTPRGRLGSVQSLQTPPLALVQANAPRLAAPFLGPGVRRLTGLLVMAEDQPRPENNVRLDATARDLFGLPQPIVRQIYTERDEQARKALFREAGRVLKRAGAMFVYNHKIKTFSHVCGTVRFGDDPKRNPLDRFCRFRGIDNLHVVDASFFPTAGGVNPSLTIAANALRVGQALVQGLPARG